MDTKLNLELSSFLKENVISYSSVDFRPNGDIRIYFDTIYQVALGLLTVFAAKHGLLYFVSTNNEGLYLLLYKSDNEE